MLRFASLGSGSKGNATLIEAGRTRILVDCGFSLKETECRLARLNCSPESLTAIVVTHEHGDHAGGVGRLSRRYHIPVWLTVGTFQAVSDKQFAHYHFINRQTDFQIGHLAIQPYAVPHDAREPCQFVVSDGQHRLALLTDTGSYTPDILDVLHGVDGLLLECNYDPQLLAQGPYPAMLKQRIDGRYGHLANTMAARLVSEINHRNLQHLVAMHLSETNNTPTHAKKALAESLNCSPEEVSVACQEAGFSWRTLN